MAESRIKLHDGVFLKEDLNLLTLEELKSLQRYNLVAKQTFSSVVLRYAKEMPNPWVSVRNASLIQQVIIERNRVKEAPLSQLQEKCLQKGISAHCDETSMVADLPIPKVVSLSRVPIDPDYYVKGTNLPRKGSDIMSAFLSSMTRWQVRDGKGAVTMVKDINEIEKLRFESIKNPQFLVTLVGLLSPLFVTFQTTSGCKGREWAYNIMHQLQKCTVAEYVSIHKTVLCDIFGTVTETLRGYTMAGKDQTVVSLVKTGALTSSGEPIFTPLWVKPISKSAFTGINITCPNLSMAYRAHVSGCQFRGGPGSSMGALMNTIGSWGFPTTARRELEEDLSVILAMEAPLLILGELGPKALFISESWKYYRDADEILSFYVPPMTAIPTIPTIHYVTSMAGYANIFSRIRNPIATTLVNLKSTFVTYDQKELAVVCHDKLYSILRQYTSLRFAVIAHVIPADFILPEGDVPLSAQSIEHNSLLKVLRFSRVRSPYDALSCITNYAPFEAKACTSGDMDTVPRKVYGSAEWRVQINTAIALSYGIFLGSADFANHHRANLVQPLPSNLLQYNMTEVIDEDGNITVEYSEEITDEFLTGIEDGVQEAIANEAKQKKPMVAAPAVRPDEAPDGLICPSEDDDLK